MLYVNYEYIYRTRVVRPHSSHILLDKLGHWLTKELGEEQGKGLSHFDI